MLKILLDYLMYFVPFISGVFVMIIIQMDVWWDNAVLAALGFSSMIVFQQLRRKLDA